MRNRVLFSAIAAALASPLSMAYNTMMKNQGSNVKSQEGTDRMVVDPGLTNYPRSGKRTVAGAKRMAAKRRNRLRNKGKR